MNEKTSKKRKYITAYAQRIRNLGHEMADRCSYCEMHDKECIVSAGSGRCSECFGRSRKCDVSGPTLEDWEALEREEARLRQEKAKLKAERAEAFSKILRLERQSEAAEEKLAKFRKRAAHMLKLGLKSIDELDALEEAEEREAERVATEATAEGEPPAPSLTPGATFVFPSPSASFWEALDAGGETPQATQGS